jgi:hypothetical protein
MVQLRQTKIAQLANRISVEHATKYVIPLRTAYDRYDGNVAPILISPSVFISAIDIKKAHLVIHIPDRRLGEEDHAGQMKLG